MNEGMRLRARVLLRARWRAVIGLGVVAGLLGGGLIALATAARETDRSLDTYMDRLGGPDAAAVFCSPGRQADDAEAECFGYHQRDELARLQSDDRVEAAGRVAPAPVLMRPARGAWGAMFAIVILDEPIGFQRAPVIDGVVADPDDPGQVMINEKFARDHDITVGDRLDVAPITWEQFGTDEPPEMPAAPAVPTRVTAILRTPDDLQSDASTETQISESTLYLGRGWVQAVGEDDFARYGLVVGMRLRPGADADEVIRAAAGGQDYSVIGPLWDVRALSDAVQYDARAAYAATAVAVLAGAVFLAQLAARQARRELDDAEPLRALGATRGLIVRSTLPRWTLSLTIATGVAVATAALLRPVGPIGLGRRLIPRPRMSVEPVVAVGGLLLLVAVMLGAALLTTWLATRPAGARSRRSHSTPLPAGVPPTAATGFTLGFSGGHRRWSVITVVAVASAVAAAVAAATLVASLGHLTSEPARYGATWDMSAASVFGEDSAKEMARTIGGLPGVEAAAGVIGNDAMIGDEQLYAYALAPIEGLPEGIAPVITRGRAPIAAGEVALGALTMDNAGVDLGDTVPMRYLDRTEELVVVGEAIINDGYEERPGAGAVVHHEWVEQVDGENFASDVVVRFEPESREAGIRAMEAALPETAVPAQLQVGIRDLQRIDSWLTVLTVFAAALAAATFAHALIVTVRRQQRQVGVLRALGFSRRQVRSSVAWLASLVAAAAVILGVPIGTAVGRWGWGRLAGNLGVPSVPVVPPAAVLLAAASVLLVANLMALPLGWRAARVRPVDALRAE